MMPPADRIYGPGQGAKNVVTILKGVNHFSIQRIVFPAGAKMLIFGTLSKFNTGRLPWQPAGN